MNKEILDKFDPSFFKEEVKCDYRITTTQKKLWAIEIDLVSELFRVCKKHDLRVFIYAGSLLGTIRHGGFIPWDDDMDLFLPREDYDKLVEVAPQEFKEPYFLQNALSDREFFIGYSRLRNSDTTGILKWEKSLTYNNGVYIDIFVMDAFIDDPKLVAEQRKKAKFYAKLAGHYYADPAKRNMMQKAALALYQKTFCKLVPYETIIRKYNSILRMYEGKTDKYAILTHTDSFNNWCDKADIAETIWMDYENIKVPVPVNYKKMLTTQYGDYMKLPEPKDRGMDHGDNITYDPDVPYKEYIRNHQ
ncbi:MAG: LicD family protein [Erysipelotrichaceae bacterium]|nr:LicD family protein [Erysipelotrichaceae bacterium]